MSRIGSKAIDMTSNVTASLTDCKSAGSVLEIKGPLGSLSLNVPGIVEVLIRDNKIELGCKAAANDKTARAKWGLYRALINNMVIGVSVGFKKQMELVGVGYRAVANSNILDLSVGHSHHDIISLPKEVKVSVVTEKGQPPRVIMESHDKQLLGQVCARIRALRPPEPYKGKGIKFVGEIIRRKAGKTAKK